MFVIWVEVKSVPARNGRNPAGWQGEIRRWGAAGPGNAERRKLRIKISDCRMGKFRGRGPYELEPNRAV